MKNKSKWYSVLLIGLVLLLTSSLVACGKSKERQEIIDYLNAITPVMEAHASWNEDQNAFAQARNLEYEEIMAGVGELAHRMEKIYIDVETSMPPQELSDFKRKWSRVCQLDLQALALTIQCLDTSDTSLLREINELTFEANAIDDEVGQELLRIIDEYDIDMEDLY